METIKLDLIPSGKMPSLHASQYDDGRDYHIDLTENRVPYTLDGTETISLTVRKCDNTLVTMDIANTFADKSYIEFITTEQMCACSGFNYGEITLEKNGDKISSLNFYLQVEGAPDEGGITSQSEINNLARQVHDIVVEELADNGASETGYDNTESGLEATNVQDAIDEVNTKIENIPSVDAYTKQESDSFLADEYDATQTYAVGDYCIHEGGLYVCNTAISTAEDWNASHWTLTDVGSALEAITSIIPTKTSQLQNDSGFASIDDSATANNKAWSSKKTTEEVTKAIDNVTNWRAKEKFDGTYTDWLINNNILSHDDRAKTAVIPMVSGAIYKIVASGSFNRFIIKTAENLAVGASAGSVYSSLSPTSPAEYTYENTGNSAFLLITLDWNSSSFNCNFSVIETTKDDADDFTVNGISVLAKEDLDSYLNTITDGNYLKDADFVDSTYCLNGGKIDANLTGRTILCPMSNGLKYSVNISGNINRFVVAVADNNTPNTTYTIVYNAGITTLANRNMSFDYVNSNNKKYFLVFYYYGTPETTITKTVEELSFNGKMTVSGIEVALAEQIPLTYDNYMSDLSVDSVANASDLYVLYDALVTAHPEYISKNTLGQDNAGNNIVEYVLTSGNYNSQTGHRTEDTEIVKPKILVVTGVHGYERSSVMSTYQFVRDLCNGNPKVADLRENYIIKVIPCVTPSGFNADTRTNSNGVNINRNFADNWTQTSVGDNYSGASAADQLETQIVQTWITANNDAVLYVDFHNSGYDNEVSYIQGSNSYTGMSDIKVAYLKQTYMTSAYWKEIEQFASNLIFAYTGGEDQIASSNRYAHITGGLLSILLEASWNQNGTGKHSKMTIKTGAEALGNMLIGILKAL